MNKPLSIASKREQHRVEIRADKLSKELSLKRQKFTSSIQNNSTSIVKSQKKNILIYLIFYFHQRIAHRQKP